MPDFSQKNRTGPAAIIRAAILAFVVSFPPMSLLWGQTVLPSAPTNLSAVCGSDGSITLTWNASSSQSTVGYNVYEYDPDSEHKTNSTPILNTKYVFSPHPVLFHLGQPPQSSRTYVVRSVQVSPYKLESIDSNKVTITVNNKNSLAILTSKKGLGFIDIAKQAGFGNWSSPKRNGFGGYNIYISGDEITFGLVNSEPIENVSSYLIKNLEVGKKYYFVFTIVTTQGTESPPSQSIHFIAQ